MVINNTNTMRAIPRSPCGLKLRGYQQYEYNEGYPEVPGLVAIADYFGVSLDYLMGRTDVREINRGQP